jgi:glycogen(starch) synthase
MSPPQPSRGMRRPRRVLMTTDTVGGVWTYSLDLCRGLERHGISVMLVSLGRMPDRTQTRQAAELPNVVLVPTAFRLEWMSGCEADIARSGDLLLQLEQKFQPDVVHINGYCHAALPFRAPILAVAHSCVVSWWHACRRAPLPAEWSAYRDRVRSAVEAAHILVAPTAAFLDCFERLHGKARRSRVIWNGRDERIFKPGLKRNLVFAAGRPWDEAKNVALLCEAARGLGVPVAVAGDISGPEGGAAAIDHITALGRLSTEDLAAWLSAASIFVAPARYEPFGLTILEAALSSCALVLGDIPSLRELWDDAAVFVHPSDAAGLRVILEQLVRDPAHVAELGRCARARAGKFTVEHMANAYRQTYAKIAQSQLEAVA